jgi:hypothetical protein
LQALINKTTSLLEIARSHVSLRDVKEKNPYLV